MSTDTKNAPKNYRVRGSEFVGIVTSAKAPKTVTIKRELVVYVSKYERYKKVTSKIHAHNPEWINAKENDIVRVGETRKISKTKSFVITEIMGASRGHAIHEEMNEGSKATKGAHVKHEGHSHVKQEEKIESTPAEKIQEETVDEEMNDETTPESEETA